MMQGSNWRSKAVVRLDIHSIVYKPLWGSSYIPLPKYLANKKAIINLKNDDDECFKWCITRALNPLDNHPERITRDLIEQSQKLDWSGIVFPVAVDANIINKFERHNNINLRATKEGWLPPPGFFCFANFFHKEYNFDVLSSCSQFIYAHFGVKIMVMSNAIQKLYPIYPRYQGRGWIPPP